MVLRLEPTHLGQQVPVTGVTSVNVVEFGCRFVVAIDHSAAVAIWGGNTSTMAGVSSAMASVCM
jgi:hypothetical protein